MPAPKSQSQDRILHADTRIVVKFKEYHATDAAAIAVLERSAGVHFVPFATLEPELRAASQPPFDRFIVATVSERANAEEIARKLQALKEVDVAYVESGPAPPPVTPTDDPRFANQGYLTAAPEGIDATWAWGFTDGYGVGFVDLEQGWLLNHEDLAAANITLISGLNQDYQSHGTSVLGEVLATDNTRGDVGIAPRARGRVVSEWRTSTTFSTAAAILSAAQVMSHGDVLLIESQTSPANLPRETEALTFDAIRHAIDTYGIVVIEAAGNGSTDLDAWTDSAGRYALDRSSKDFQDSGAILVGAGSSTAPHSRLFFSNFGSRIDCYAWGENIDTLSGDSTTSYTGGFNGTSGASPIVAGAAVLMHERCRHAR
jgi:subtilisin family serine protease